MAAEPTTAVLSMTPDRWRNRYTVLLPQIHLGPLAPWATSTVSLYLAGVWISFNPMEMLGMWMQH